MLQDLTRRLFPLPLFLPTRLGSIDNRLGLLTTLLDTWPLYNSHSPVCFHFQIVATGMTLFSRWMGYYDNENQNLWLSPYRLEKYALVDDIRWPFFPPNLRMWLLQYKYNKRRAFKMVSYDTSTLLYSTLLYSDSYPRKERLRYDATLVRVAGILIQQICPVVDRDCTVLYHISTKPKAKCFLSCAALWYHDQPCPETTIAPRDTLLNTVL